MMCFMYKKELLIEETVIVLLGCLLFAGIGLGASAVLLAKATLVNCGMRSELVKSCEQDNRCCALLERHLQQAGRRMSDDKPLDQKDLADYQDIPTSESSYE